MLDMCLVVGPNGPPPLIRSQPSHLTARRRPDGMLEDCRLLSCVHGRRGLVGEGLMRPLIVIEREIVAEALPHGPRRGMLVQIHVLVLHCPPQPFRKDVV